MQSFVFYFIWIFPIPSRRSRRVFKEIKISVFFYFNKRINLNLYSFIKSDVVYKLLF